MVTRWISVIQRQLVSNSYHGIFLVQTIVLRYWEGGGMLEAEVYNLKRLIPCLHVFMKNKRRFSRSCIFRIYKLYVWKSFHNSLQYIYILESSFNDLHIMFRSSLVSRQKSVCCRTVWGLVQEGSLSIRLTKGAFEVVCILILKADSSSSLLTDSTICDWRFRQIASTSIVAGRENNNEREESIGELPARSASYEEKISQKYCITFKCWKYCNTFEWWSTLSS